MSNALLAPDPRIGEYRLVVPLSEAVQEAVRKIRQDLHQDHGVPLPFESAPSLAIVLCRAYEGMEPKLFERVQQVATGMKAFKVELKNFAAFPSHTIYIHLATRSPFNDLAKSLKVIKPFTKIPDHDPLFNKEPHLMIAQRLKPSQFKRMWEACEHTSFTGRFMADRMVLMKRSLANPHYQAVRQFPFAALNMQVKQGTLFT